jgi:asparagine synthase (glutamine-hydrolysing)
MCGITGAVSRVPDPDLPDIVRRMNATLAHRGPDGDGFWSAPHVAFGHRRLAIIDLDTGAQPMHDASGRYTITFNGEIYNLGELRARQQAAGATFLTHSDTETILHAKGPHELRGMFAYGLWDAQMQTLVLARDRFGKKPLFYAESGYRLFFGSEIKALRAALETTNVDEAALDQYLMLGYVPGTRTIAREIKRVPPGCTLTWDRERGARISRYWTWEVDDRDDDRDLETWARDVENVFDDAVRLRLIADVPLGSFLSGGLDSSTVVAACLRHAARPFHTFSIRAAGAPSPDADAAHFVSKLLGTTHHETVLQCPSPDEVVALMQHFDEPFADSSMIPTAAVSKAAREQVTVALSGDGGDEIFGGYGVYRDYMAIERIAALPLASRAAGWSKRAPARMPGKRTLEHIGTKAGSRYRHLVSHLDRRELASVLTTDPAGYLDTADLELAELFHESKKLGPVARAQLIDSLHGYLPGDILPKVDLAAMRHSLEVRAPLLDHVLAESVARLPARLRMHRGRGKLVLRQIARRYLPVDIIERKKVGFSIPLADWLAGPLRPLVERYLAPNGPLAAYLDLARLPTMRADRTAEARRMFALLSLGVWAERHA